MSATLALAGGMALMSVLGGISQNQAAARAFEMNAEQTTDSYNKQIAQLQEQAKAYDDSVRLEMTKARFNGLQDTAVTSNIVVEKNISGNTAQKLYDQSKINQLMTHNVLAKKAEDNAVNFGVEMENARDRANQAIYSGQAQAMQNSVSTLGMVSNGISAGVAGYSLGSSVFGSSSVYPTESLGGTQSINPVLQGI